MLEIEGKRESVVYTSEIVEAINVLIDAVCTLYVYEETGIRQEMLKLGRSNTTNYTDLLMQIDETVKKLQSHKL